MTTGRVELTAAPDVVIKPPTVTPAASLLILGHFVEVRSIYQCHESRYC